MRSRSQEGYILVTVLLVLALVGLLGVAALDQSTSALRSAGQTAQEERSFYAANAGIEWTMAYFTTHRTVPPSPHSETLPMGAYSASYTVTITPENGKLLVRSVGTSGESTRVITATLGAPVPNAYRGAIYSGSTLIIENNGEICGSLYSVGDMTLSNNVHVWTSGPDSPCPNESEGTAIAAGRLYAEKAEIDGGWCDSVTVGPACDYTKPVVEAVEDPDLSEGGELHQLAAASGTVYDRSRTFAGNSGDNVVYFVNGDLTIHGLTVTGRVTYVATGNIIIDGDVAHSPSCSDSNPCAAAFIADEAIQVKGDKGRTIWGVLIAVHSGLSVDNNATFHGSVVASPIDAGNNSWFYSDNPFYENPPPGLPGLTSGILGWGE